MITEYWLLGYTSDCGDHVIVYLMQWWRKAWKAVPHELCGMWPFCLLPIRRGYGGCPFHICCWWSTEFSCSWDKSIKQLFNFAIKQKFQINQPKYSGYLGLVSLLFLVGLAFSFQKTTRNSNHHQSCSCKSNLSLSCVYTTTWQRLEERRDQVILVPSVPSFSTPLMC